MTDSSAPTFGIREGLLAALVGVPLLVFLSLQSLEPPSVVGADAPETEVSAERALEHLKIIAAEPHPMGSEAHAEVRDYLIEQIEGLGLEAEVQVTTVFENYDRQNRVARVQNVLTRLPGSEGGSTLLLSAHYDSVLHSPGASDDGAGVVALLEILRALQVSEPLANDVIVLFSDGEENGLLGAKAFQDQHPWAEEVDLVVNLEARGASGPSIMFETGPRTGSLMGDFASFTPRPVAASYSFDIYRFLPNNTDFTIYKKADKAGFNFAYINDLRAYHSMFDNIERIDLRSLQHHADNTYAIVRGLGNEDLSNLPEAAERIYFNLPFLGLVVYSTSLALPLGILCTLFGLAVLILGFRSRRLTVLKLLLGLLACLLMVVVTLGVALLLGNVLYEVLVAEKGLISSTWMYLFGLLLASMAVASMVAVWVGRKLELNLAAGGLLLWLTLTVGSALQLPSSSFLFLWPTLSLALSIFLRLRNEEPLGRGAGFLLFALAIPALWIWPPTLQLVAAAFGSRAVVILGGIAGLFLVSLIPQIRLLSQEKLKLPLAALGLGLVLFLAQCFTVGYDVERPRSNTVFYSLDQRAGEARWNSADSSTDSFTAQYLGDDPESLTFNGFFIAEGERLLATPAEIFPVPEIEVTPLGEEFTEEGDGEETAEETGEVAEFEETSEVDETTPEDGPRELRLQVRTTGPISSTMLRLAADVPFDRVEIDGRKQHLELVRRREDSPPGLWFGILYAPPGESFEIRVVLEDPAPLQVETVAFGIGMPELPGIEPRSADQRIHSWRLSDLSLVRQDFEF